MGRLTTHVLDTTRGRPAAGVAIWLYRDGQLANGPGAVRGAGAAGGVAMRTNADGRTDAPLLEGDAFVAGVYELVFDIGAYFADGDLPDPPFLGLVTVRFGVADPSSNYHVPLLASPWAYSTYRGS
jgi:5-hydroxyisourate hydrolase